MDLVGIDVGGSGIKGALVDTVAGALRTERKRIKTPQPATPDAVAETVARVVAASGGDGPVGVGFPSAIADGVALTAANIDDSFVGVDLPGLFGAACGRPVAVLNDADAAGLAEAVFGAAKGVSGTVLVITIGTGLGSALVIDGHLVPNTEFGHLEFRGDIAEAHASDAARKRQDLDWETWAQRFDAYLHHLDFVLHPARIVLGGGGSKKWRKFGHLLTAPCEVVPAELGNEAGLIGAAMHAERTLA